MEDLERQIEVLHDRHLVISKENPQLQISISEEEERAHVALEGFNTYRGKMEGHKAAVLHATSQTGSHKELEEKQALVRQLRQEKEDLEQDLENPNGSTVKAAKVKKFKSLFHAIHSFLFSSLFVLMPQYFTVFSFTPFICLLQYTYNY